MVSIGPMVTPDELPPAVAAATVVVARDGVAGLEVLMLQRSEVGAFAGMWVFPGGRVDPADPGEDEVAKARSAAVREAAEEVALTIDRESIVLWAHWMPPPIAPPTSIPIGPNGAPRAAPSAAAPAEPTPVPTGCEPGSPLMGSAGTRRRK